MYELAIVIPAYKQAFFNQALRSLAQQTNKNFTVYIGDDYSPFDLKRIVDEFTNDLNIVYKRFPFNIGSKNLVNQWTRCIELTGDEKWLWLFSDDDIAEKNCVESFYKILAGAENKFDVYRFNTCLIDQAGKVIHEPLIGPDEESSEEMAYYLLKGKRGNSMPDHIFSRQIYNKSGGFVFTDYAQSADWAASILFSKDKGMCVIQNAKIFWRQSGMNVSSVSKANRSGMITGYLTFLDWLDNHFQYLDNKTNSLISRKMIRNASQENFIHLMKYHYKGFGLSDFPILLTFVRKHFGISFYTAFTALCEINISVLTLYIRIFLSSVKKSLKHNAGLFISG